MKCIEVKVVLCVTDWVFYRGHCWQVQEVEGVLEGAGGPSAVEDSEYQN